MIYARLDLAMCTLLWPLPYRTYLKGTNRNVLFRWVRVGNQLRRFGFIPVKCRNVCSLTVLTLLVHIFKVAALMYCRKLLERCSAQMGNSQQFANLSLSLFSWGQQSVNKVFNFLTHKRVTLSASCSETHSP